MGNMCLKVAQDEVNLMTSYQTTVGNPAVCGTAEQAVQGVGQVRVVGHGMLMRLGLQMSGKHIVTSCVVEHDTLVEVPGREGWPGRVASVLMERSAAATRLSSARRGQLGSNRCTLGPPSSAATLRRHLWVNMHGGGRTRDSTF